MTHQQSNTNKTLHYKSANLIVVILYCMLMSYAFDISMMMMMNVLRKFYATSDKTTACGSMTNAWPHDHRGQEKESVSG